MSDSSTTAVAPAPTVFVLFGASGDLARRLVLPAFFRLAQEGLLPSDWRLIGSGRRRESDDEFRSDVHGALSEFGPRPEEGPWEEFAPRVAFAGDGFSPADPGRLLERIAEAERDLGEGTRRVFYLGVPPTAFESLTRAIGAHGLADSARVVFEKPFGTSMSSFHLGKEATQQLHAVRFANGLFSSSWDRHHVAAVQVDVPETLDVSERASFYDETGAVLDMLVTHLFQVAAEVAMEPPASFAAEDVAAARAEVVGAFRKLVRDDVVRGQFEGYRDIDEVADDSTTETFVAARMWVDTERWQGVPFLLRTGKRMAQSHQKVSLIFCAPEGGPLGEVPARGNVLVFDLAGDGALSVALTLKLPGTGAGLETAYIDLPLTDIVGADPLPPYVRLIHDVLVGDRALFTRPDGLSDVWTAAGEALEDDRKPESYTPGSWGPEPALRLADPTGWVLPTP